MNTADGRDFRARECGPVSVRRAYRESSVRDNDRATSDRNNGLRTSVRAISAPISAPAISGQATNVPVSAPGTSAPANVHGKSKPVNVPTKERGSAPRKGTGVRRSANIARRAIRNAKATGHSAARNVLRAQPPHLYNIPATLTVAAGTGAFPRIREVIRRGRVMRPTVARGWRKVQASDLLRSGYAGFVDEIC